jgi:hypothetical protein
MLREFDLRLEKLAEHSVVAYGAQEKIKFLISISPWLAAVKLANILSRAANAGFQGVGGS